MPPIPFTYTPFCYNVLETFINSYKEQGVRKIKIKVGSLEVSETYNETSGGWEWEVLRTSEVWANTRRFYKPDFMFFCWIYNIFSSHDLMNHWWEQCEIENPLEELNPEDDYIYLLPSVCIASSMEQNDTIELWNFAYNLYMTITPSKRIRPLRNTRLNHTQATTYQTTTVAPTDQADFTTYPAIGDLTIRDDTANSRQDNPVPCLPKASELGFDLGFVESDDE